MEELDLTARAADVEAPEGRVPPAGGRSDAGRLVTLAQWWGRVAPDRPDGPRRVEHRWVPGPVTLAGPVRASVADFAPDLPPGVTDGYAFGVAAADEAADTGTDLVVLSVPDAPAAATLAAHLLSLDPVDAMGWPSRAGVDDGTWVAEVTALRDGLRRVRDRFEAADLLTALGSPAVAAGAGFLLQAGVRRTPVLLDGAGAAACAMLVYRVTRRVRGWWQAAQSSGSVLHDATLEKLMLKPILTLDIAAENGTAGRLALAVLEAATASPAETAAESPAAEPSVAAETPATTAPATAPDGAPAVADTPATTAPATPADETPAAAPATPRRRRRPPAATPDETSVAADTPATTAPATTPDDVPAVADTPGTGDAPAAPRRRRRPPAAKEP